MIDTTEQTDPIIVVNKTIVFPQQWSVSIFVSPPFLDFLGNKIIRVQRLS